MATKEDRWMEIHAEAIRRVNSVAAAYQPDRMNMNQDRRFARLPGAQWDGDWERQFANSPRIESNQLAKDILKVLTDIRENRFLVDFRPKTATEAAQETAKTLNGMFRADWVKGHGAKAFDAACDDAVTGGFSAIWLKNDWEDEKDPENDSQHIRFVWLPDADLNVFFDPGSKHEDKSDADWCVILFEMTHEAYEDQFGQKPERPSGNAIGSNGTSLGPSSGAQGNQAGFASPIWQAYYEWFKPDTVTVAYYFRKRQKRERLFKFRHTLTDQAQTYWASELTDEKREELAVEGWEESSSRMATRCEVNLYLLDGNGVLEDCGRVPGDVIPVVPVYGQRFWVDSKERAVGIVAYRKDEQRIYNALLSWLSKAASYSPIRKPIVDPSQVAGLEEHIQNVNMDDSPVVMLNALRDENTGQVIQAGALGYYEPPEMPATWAQLFNIVVTGMREGMGSQQEVREVKSNTSYAAMELAATRIDAMPRIYIDSARKAMRWIGAVWLAMIKDLRVEAGTKAETRTEDGKLGFETLYEPFTDSKGVYGLKNDIAGFNGDVVVDVSEATATIRDKTVRMLTLLKQGETDPTLSRVLSLLILRQLDGEGIEAAQEWARKQLVQAGVEEPTKEELQAMQQAAQEPDPQAQALLAVAAKESALAQKAEADTALSRAKTVETLARAGEVSAKTTREDVLAAADVASAAQTQSAPAQQFPQ